MTPPPTELSGKKFFGGPGELLGHFGEGISFPNYFFMYDLQGLQQLHRIKNTWTELGTWSERQHVVFLIRFIWSRVCLRGLWLAENAREPI